MFIAFVNAETIYCEALRIVRDIIIKDKYTGYYNFVVRTLIEWISVNEPNAVVTGMPIRYLRREIQWIP